MNSPADMVVARSAAGGEMSLNKLKYSVTLERRYDKYNSKYRHRPYFSNSNGRRVIVSSLPVWANVLILIAIILVALFIVGLIVGYLQERNRHLKSGQPMRWKKVLLGGLSVAFFLWIPVYIVRFIKSRRGKGQSGSYAEIDEDKQRLNTTTTTVETTKPWNMDRGSADAASRYEPMGYKSSVYDPYSAYAGVTDPSAAGASSKEAEAARPVSPVGATGFHQPPPPQDSGDLANRSPSPPRASFSPAHPPPTYNA